MLKTDYDKVILERIEKSFDLVLPAAALISMLIAFGVSRSDTPRQYIYYDLTMALVLLAVFLFRKQLDVKVKILTVIISVLLLGVAALVDVGFSGTGITLIVASNVLAVAFLSFYGGILFSGISLASILVIWLLVQLGVHTYTGPNEYLLNSPEEWLVHAGSLSLVFIALHVVFWAIKNHLKESIKKLENSVEKTYNLAYYDQLTGLPNRHMFTEEVLKRTEIHNVNGFLVLFDLKGFKLINSIYGSELGDEILTKIASIFYELKGDREMVARISGNEYSWWMEGLNYKTLQYRLEYLKEQFYKRLRSMGITKKIEFHVCYAHFPTDGTSIEEVYQKATMALEHAKRQGKTNAVSYNEHLEKITRENEMIRELLLSAIDRRDFQIAYQEKTDARTGSVIGVEALARWQHAEQGNISPGIFIPIVEQSNLAVPFGNMIITMVLDDYGLLQSVYGEDIRVSINISPTHLSSKGFKVFIMEEISRRGYRPDRIMLEITEEVMIEDMEIVDEVLKPIRAFGVGISLDDFGTGYSSLNYLAQMELDELKLDKSFIDQLEEDSKAVALVNAMIQLTSEYGIDIVAEGVETLAQKDLLNRLGCYIIQGYYYSRPAYLKELVKDMKRGLHEE